jgi:anti-anti-sigma regulatory factor
MEIGISKKGELRILTARGNLRLQQLRVLGKHLDVLLESGARKVVLDLTAAALPGGDGLAALARSARKFRERGAELTLAAAPSVLAAVRASGCLTGAAEVRLCGDLRTPENAGAAGDPASGPPVRPAGRSLRRLAGTTVFRLPARKLD